MDTINNNRRQIFDDMFDAFSMLAGGNYVSLYDMKLKLTRYSAASVEMFGLPGEYIPDGADDWSNYVHPEDRKRYQDAMAGMFAKQSRSYDLSYRVRTTKGDYILFRFIGAVLRDEDGNPSMIGGMTINEGMQEKVDPITVLPNHYAFFSDLPELMRTNEKNIVLLIGINRMTSINESLGYSHGNRVLQQVSWVIQETVKENGTVYRKEGAKFAIVSNKLDEHEMTVIYRKIRQKLLTSIRVDDTRHNLTINGGMISFQGFQLDPRTLQSCLTYAYNESKIKKHGSLVNFDGNTKRDDKTVIQMLNTLRTDLISDCTGFYLEYQPVLTSLENTPVGVEALIRWKHDDYGIVLPDEFMHIIEEDVAFEELGDWILRTALTDGKKLLEKFPDIKMGINISPTQLSDEYFVESLQQLLKRTGFPAKNLCLEFTKDCRMLDPAHICDVALALHTLDIKIIIDDYGSGFESLDFLKMLSADYVKFDRKFIQNLESSEQDRLVLQHLSELATVYNTNICVKGIENKATADIIKNYPIRSVQGNFFAVPQGIDEAIAFLKTIVEETRTKKGQCL